MLGCNVRLLRFLKPGAAALLGLLSWLPSQLQLVVETSEAAELQRGEWGMEPARLSSIQEV